MQFLEDVAVRTRKNVMTNSRLTMWIEGWIDPRSVQGQDPSLPRATYPTNSFPERRLLQTLYGYEQVTCCGWYLMGRDPFPHFSDCPERPIQDD